MFNILQSISKESREGKLKYPTASEFITGMTNRLQALVRTRLWLQVIIGMIFGFVVGAILGPDLGLISPEKAKWISNWLALPGKLFLSLIGMVVSILVLTSIILGLSSSAGGEQLRTIGVKLTIYVVVTTTAAAALGIFLALVIQPGSYVDIAVDSPNEQVQVTNEAPKKVSIKKTLPGLIAGLIPQYPLEALAKGEMLGIVVFAILVGIACTTANREKVKPFLLYVEAVFEICMTVVKWAMFLAPWAVFGLLAQLVAQVGMETIWGMGVYVLTVLAGLLLLLILYLVLVAVLGRWNPLKFYSKIGEAQLLAFSTSSSAAVMPLSIKTAVERLNVSNSVAGLVIPLCATINMAGTALYQAVAIIFLAQMSGIDLTVAQLSLIVVTLVASSIGSPGTPGVGLVILGNIAGDFGIPITGLVLILGVDRLLDMSRTAVNLTGDLVACVLLGSKNNMKSESTQVVADI